MPFAFSSFSLANLMMLLRGPDQARPSPRPAPVPEFDEDREVRAILNEMLSCHPEAIQSEHGMMTLMRLYPKHF